MALYVYKKKLARRFPLLPTGFSFIPFIFITLGLSLIAFVAYPIISFQLFLTPKFTVLVRPIPDEVIVQAMENEERVLGIEDKDNGEVGGNETPSTQVDYTKASNWFPKKPPEMVPSQEKEYTLSIPKLGIKDARVVIGGDNLGESLIHYGGTSLPGDWGKVVIFGHSVLPQFFNPKNYKTIFSTLPTLETNDQILVDFDGITYTYEVFDLKIVQPDDVSVFEQKFDSSYMALITCVPPGTYWKRLIVTARLKNI